MTPKKPRTPVKSAPLTCGAIAFEADVVIPFLAVAPPAVDADTVTVQIFTLRSS